MLEILCALLGASVFFLGGMETANWYHDRADKDREEALRRQYARLSAGIDNDALPRHMKYSVSPAFEEQFGKHGRAVERLQKAPDRAS